jgi:hypothetical protein
LYLCVYVDDILLACSRLVIIDKTIYEIQKRISNQINCSNCWNVSQQGIIKKLEIWFGENIERINEQATTAEPGEMVFYPLKDECDKELGEKKVYIQVE